MDPPGGLGTKRPSCDPVMKHLIMLQVSTDCSPEQLLEYLQGEAATAASTAAVAHGRARQEEEELLEAASDALGTRHVMRMVSRYWQPDINRSLQQLIATADAVKAAFDLSGMSPEPRSAALARAEAYTQYTSQTSASLPCCHASAAHYLTALCTKPYCIALYTTFISSFTVYYLLSWTSRGQQRSSVQLCSCSVFCYLCKWQLCSSYIGQRCVTPPAMQLHSPTSPMQCYLAYATTYHSTRVPSHAATHNQSCP